jgi:hypothetical protein
MIGQVMRLQARLDEHALLASVFVLAIGAKLTFCALRHQMGITPLRANVVQYFCYGPQNLGC